jgi:hypothetical protein
MSGAVCCCITLITVLKRVVMAGSSTLAEQAQSKAEFRSVVASDESATRPMETACEEY